MVSRGDERRPTRIGVAPGTLGESGSAIVAALALALTLTVLAAAVTARSAGAVLGASARHDREHARTMAEDALHAAILAADDLAAWLPSGAGGLGSHLHELSGAVEASAPYGDAVQVDLGSEAGDIMLRIDATVGRATSTATARLRPRSSADLAWFTESRARDPMLQGLPRLTCTWPMGDPRRDPACLDMPSPQGPIGGHVHSNDPLPESDGEDLVARMTSSSLAPSSSRHRSELSLPRDVAMVLDGRPPTCRFRGPTLLRFDGPRVRVTSPRSVTRPDDALDAEDAIGCLGIDRDLLADVVVVDLPVSAVIEVVEDTADDCFHHPLGIDRDEDLERVWRCDAGDAFVWGRYHGVRSVVAHGSIQIVWDLEPGDASAARALDHGDVLGLVAADSIVLRRPTGLNPLTLRRGVLAFAGPWIAPFGAHPLDAPNPTATHWDAPNVVAAMAALRGSLAPQNSSQDPAPSSPTTIVGSLAARFAPATVWERRDHAGRPDGTLEFPIHLTYDERLGHGTVPPMPHIDAGRLRIVELDVG